MNFPILIWVEKVTRAKRMEEYPDFRSLGLCAPKLRRAGIASSVLKSSRFADSVA